MSTQQDTLPAGWEWDNENLIVSSEGICDHTWVEVRHNDSDDADPWFSEIWFTRDNCETHTEQFGGWGWSATPAEQFERIGDPRALKAEDFCPICGKDES